MRTWYGVWSSSVCKAGRRPSNSVDASNGTGPGFLRSSADPADPADPVDPVTTSRVTTVSMMTAPSALHRLRDST